MASVSVTNPSPTVMDLSRAPRRRAATVARGSSQADLRKQLVLFAWMRLVILTTAFITTVLLDFAIKPDRVSLVQTRPLYAIFLGAYALSGLNLAALALARRTSTVALVQFGGDIVVETALLHVLVPHLEYDGSIAIAMGLFFLTTIFACTYLDRVEGALFATGALLLQVAAHVVPRMDAFAGFASPLAAPELTHAVRNLFVLMFTFYGTSWLVASRAERLRAMGERLQAVTDDYRDLQAFNEHVIQSMGSGLVTTDEASRITFSNQAAQRLLGSESLQGQRLHDILGWSEHADEDVRPIREGRASHRFGRNAVLAGGRMALEVSVSRLEDKDGRALGLLFLLEDVTDLRALESEVRLKEKMAAIGEMAAGIAHEIRNPLASISGSVQILGRQADVQGERRKLLDIVLAESRRLDLTIKGFLDFARPRPPRRRRVDLSSLARETVTLLSHSQEVLPQHRLAVAEGPPAWVDADPDQIRQVLWNLCQNGIKAMPEGGSLELAASSDAEQAVLVVADTGVGMSAETLSRAFQPLAGDFREGSGLGLAIVYRIVRDHQGQVNISSRAGAGTRIEVRLPARNAPETT